MIGLKEISLSATQAMARENATSVNTELNQAMDTVRSLAHIFSGFEKLNPEERRGSMNKHMQTILEKNPNFLGVWTCWEPNALDGLDGKFTNQEGTDATGRLIPYWNRGAGKIVLMTSVAVPIFDRKEAFVGVAGIDIELAKFQKMIDGIHPYETVISALFSNHGIIVAHQGSVERRKASPWGNPFAGGTGDQGVLNI